MVSDDFRPAVTGVGVYLERTIPELLRRGHRVAVVTSRRGGQPAEESWGGAAIFRTFSLPVLGFYQALPSRRTLRGVFDRVAPDLVHHHYVGFLMRRAVALARARGIPQLATHHFGPEVLSGNILLRPFRSWMWRELVAHQNRCDAVIAPSPEIAKTLTARGVRAPLRVVPNALRYDDGPVTPAARPPGLTLLYAGRLAWEKNLPLLLRALARLIPNHPNAVLWIAGRGPEEKGLRALCRSLGLERNVMFLGFLNEADLARRYAACDIFVLPSVQEVQGLVLLEAMWFGRPVIVTNAIPSARDLVEDGVNGFTVAPDDPVALAERLSSLAADAVRRAAMGAAARRSAENFRLAPVTDALERVYREWAAPCG